MMASNDSVVAGSIWQEFSHKLISAHIQALNTARNISCLYQLIGRKAGYSRDIFLVTIYAAYNLFPGLRTQWSKDVATSIGS